MPDTRTDRIAMLGAELDRLDPPDVRGARRAVIRARDDLRALQHSGGAQAVVEAYRYRVARAVDVMHEAQRRGPAPLR
jgi:hypothetical protein